MPPPTPLARILTLLHFGKHDHSSETDSTGTTLVDRQSGHSLAETMVELRIVPYPEALPVAPPSRNWLPTRIPDDYKGGPIRTLYAPHNASAPIRRLPTAVLTRLFSICGVFREWREILSLTHICQAWRRVALETPQLWADAVWSLSRTRFADGERGRAQFLPIFLSRTWETHPVRVRIVHMSEQRYIWDAVVPHLSKLSSLSVVVQTEDEVVDVLETLRSAGMPWLVAFELVGYRIPHSPLFGRLAPWRDSDFPRLRELKLLGDVFSRATSVRSIRAVHLVAWSNVSGYVDGLSRCADMLESLTLEPWGTRRPDLATTGRSDSLPIHLPRVRQLRITGDAGRVREVFASLIFPQTVHVDLTFWDKAPVPDDIYTLFPTYITGFHAPPFVDSLQFRLGSPLHVVVRCYAGDAERLRFKQFAHSSSMLHKMIWTFRSPHVTELAINLTSVATFSAPYAIVDPAVRLTRALKDLRRLELLGATRRSVKFRILESFLLCHGRPEAPNAESLTLGWGVQLEYGVGAAVDELEQLIEVLAAHHVTSGARLARLELCVTTDLDLDRYKSYYRIRDMRPDRVWSQRVAKRFLGRLERLADEVAILGDWEKYADDIEEEDELCGGAGRAWKEPVPKGSCWEWAPGGDSVVATRCRIGGHICRSCQQADVDPNSSDDD
ncbi:hypothetical protein LXA43DRAFT_1061359 [Ganoderma leucocontextum]|nr:hypothetical protein LXA43DRAFT_1061359 [Ganoderma leucocontextum]